jgi:hypothetical protein
MYRAFSICLFLFTWSSIATASSGTCTITIKCDVGTATCIGFSYFNSTSTENKGSCRKDSSKYLTCETWSSNAYGGNSAHYVCCDANGNGLTTKFRNVAENACSNFGTIQ